MPPGAALDKPRTVQVRAWKGVNRTDARVAMDDDELYQLTNAMTVGKGQIRILPSPGTPVTLPTPAHSIWGFLLNGGGVIIVVGADGSLTEVSGATITAIAPAGTVTTAAHLTIWRDDHILILDPITGYFTWDGTTFTAPSGASLTTALGVPNADLTFTAVNPTFGGPYPTIAYVDPGAPGAALSVVVVGLAITVNLATDGGSVITTTAEEIQAAVNANGDALELVFVTLAPGNDGTGIVIALALTTLVAVANEGGQAVAVFEGRVWFAAGRVIAFTAPNSFTNFDPSDGAGATTLTDEAFQGNIIALVSALEQLWIMGEGAVDAISNVTTTVVDTVNITTFSITNIVTGVGTAASSTVLGYFRALTFVAPFGVYALAGVTPQKLSEKLDGMFRSLTIGATASSAVAVVNNIPVLIICCQITNLDTVSQTLLCFSQGKWFFGNQGGPSWITSVLVGGASQAWGVLGDVLFRVFDESSELPWPYIIASKLYDYGSSVTPKALMKFGLEILATHAVTPTVVIDSELGSTAAVDFGSQVPTPDLSTAHIYSLKANHEAAGQYLGWTISGSDLPFDIQAVHTEVQRTDNEWSTPGVAST